MDAKERTRLIDRYRDGPNVVDAALADITLEELDARPAADEWSPREIVHHLADSETRSAIRIRQLLAEDDPIIQGYDEAAYARRLFYSDRPIEASLDALRAARRTTVELLDRMSEADWSREGTHTESGRYTAETWLEIYASHAHDHADQIRRARSASASAAGRR